MLTEEERELSTSVFVQTGLELLRALAENWRFNFLDLVLGQLLGGGEEAVSLWKEQGRRKPSKVIILGFENQNPSSLDTIRAAADKLMEKHPSIPIVFCGDELVHRHLELIKNGETTLFSLLRMLDSRAQ